MMGGGAILLANMCEKYNLSSYLCILTSGATIVKKNFSLKSLKMDFQIVVQTFKPLAVNKSKIHQHMSIAKTVHDL